MDKMIYFPHLGIRLENVGKSLDIFGFPIAYYGIIIMAGVLLALKLVTMEAKRTGQDPDFYWDGAMLGILAGVIGARIYYVIFSWDSYKNDLLSVFNIREGGLAIYGGIIGAVIAVYLYGRVKKYSFLWMMDTACMSILLGQIVGRWGNFFNREAFGGYTDGLFAMQLPVSAVRGNEITAEMLDHLQMINGIEFIQVHPTFLYESLWNLGLLVFLLWFRKHTKFHGELFFTYLTGYGLGRAWIEGLRTDQLLLPKVGLPVSQVLSIVLVVGAGTVIIWKNLQLNKKGIPAGPDNSGKE